MMSNTAGILEQSAGGIFQTRNYPPASCCWRRSQSPKKSSWKICWYFSMLIVPAAVVGGGGGDCDCRLGKLELLPWPAGAGHQSTTGCCPNCCELRLKFCKTWSTRYCCPGLSAQSPPSNIELCDKMPPTRSISCLSLVLYGIRAPIIGPFRAWKPTILMT